MSVCIMTGAIPQRHSTISGKGSHRRPSGTGVRGSNSEAVEMGSQHLPPQTDRLFTHRLVSDRPRGRAEGAEPRGSGQYARGRRRPRSEPWLPSTGVMFQCDSSGPLRHAFAVLRGPARLDADAWDPRRAVAGKRREPV